MKPTPEHCSDETINRLWDDELKRAETLASAFNLLDQVMHRRPENARAFDLSFDYASYRPEGERWVCVDLLTFDGAPDAEAPCTFIGRGASEKEARMNLLEQFAEYDNPEPEPKPRVGRLVDGGGGVQPPEYADREVTFDDDLEE